MPLIKPLYLIADELRSIANEGLQYSESEYDISRYNRLIDLAARLTSQLENTPLEGIHKQFNGNLTHLSPNIGVDAVIWQEEKILLIQRSDNGLWATPGGMVDIGETLYNATRRELYEETKVWGEPKHFLGAFDSYRSGSQSKFHLIHIIFEVDIGSQIPQTSLEAKKVGFFSPHALPPLHPGHDQRIPILIKMLRGELPIPYFDPLETPTETSI